MSATPPLERHYEPRDFSDRIALVLQGACGFSQTPLSLVDMAIARSCVKRLLPYRAWSAVPCSICALYAEWKAIVGGSTHCWPKQRMNACT